MNYRALIQLAAITALAAVSCVQQRIIASYRSQVSILMASTKKLMEANDRLQEADRKLKASDAELEVSDAELSYAAARVKAFCAEKGVKLR